MFLLRRIGKLQSYNTFYRNISLQNFSTLSMETEAQYDYDFVVIGITPFPFLPFLISSKVVALVVFVLQKPLANTALKLPSSTMLSLLPLAPNGVSEVFSL